MPVLRDSQLQTIFQTTLAKLIKSQQLIDWDYLITTTSDTTDLEEQALQQASEIEVTTRLINQAITRNAHHSQNQDDYQERFTQLKARQREAITAYETTQVEIERRHGIKAKLTRFKKIIQNATLSQDFDRATLRALCQHIQITPSGKASVIFADGTKIKIPADSY